MSEDILKDSWVPEGPISKTIKDRLKKAGKRFHSNDNISEYIEDGNGSVAGRSAGKTARCIRQPSN